MSQSITFLKSIYTTLAKGEFIELRALGRAAKREYFPSVEAAARRAGELAKASDVYFGVATRDGRGGKKGNVARIFCAWADLDAKDDIASPEERLEVSPVEPSAVVKSGKGLHCYWFFDAPVASKEIARVETLNKAIAAGLGGDAVHDASRILRVPGTVNLKYGKPLPVTLMSINPRRRYSIEELEDAFDVEPAEAFTTTTEHTFPDTDSKLPCRKAIWQGVTEGSRNNACFQLAVDLRRDGIPLGTALDLLQKWNGTNKPALPAKTVDDTAKSAYLTNYQGLGCDKSPMKDFCTTDCPVQTKKPTPNPDPPTPVLKDWELKELLNRETVPPEFVVEGIVPRRGVTLVTGEGGIGKSFMLIDMAFSISNGKKFLGHFDCLKGPVSIMDLENDESTIALRTKKVFFGRIEEDDFDSDAPMYIIKKGGLADAEFQVDSEKGLQSLDKYLEERKPVALIIDPLTAAHSRDENDNIAMRSIIRSLQKLARAHNMAVVLVHHPRKRGLVNDPGQMIRGASDLRNAVDSHLYLRRVSRDHILIDHDKSRLSPEVDSFRIEMTDSEDGNTTVFRYIGETTETAVKRAEAREAILSILQETGTSKTGEIVARLKAMGVGQTTIEGTLEQLTKDGEIQKPKRGVYALPRSEVVMLSTEEANTVVT